jgi:signal transduction histidine kinase
VKDLADYIRNNHDEIIVAWREELRRTRSRTQRELGDHMPVVLDLLAQALETASVPASELKSLADSTADHRANQNYDMNELTEELRILRRLVLDKAKHSPVISEQSKQTIPYFVAMNESLDLSMGHAVKRFMEQQDRARDVFIGILGHDLRGPLTVARTAVQSLQRSAPGLAGRRRPPTTPSSRRRAPARTPPRSTPAATR